VLELQQQLLMRDTMPRITQLKQKIVERRLIQADVAEAAHMSESRLSRIVNGRAKPNAYERRNLARALGLTTKELPG